MPVKLHYKAFGDGPTVMILHGLFGSSRNWRSMAKRLADNNQILAVDLRNHGQSGRANSMTYPEMAEDIIALMHELSLHATDLIGHSMGGKVAMQLALTYPGKINKLAILDVAPVAYPHRYGKLFTAMQELPLRDISNRQEAEIWLDQRLDDMDLTRFLLQNLIRKENGFAWRINLETIQEYIDILSGFPESNSGKHYDRPVLFLGGAKSHFIQAQYHPAIYTFFPNARVRLVEGAGHMLHIAQPAMVEEILRTYLAE